jgi:hypothetical protein
MSTRRRWTPETIQAALEPLVAELGRFPTRAEFADRGLSGLPGAMQRHGGVAEWKARVTPAAPAAPVTVPREWIAERAYYLALEAPHGDPLVHWLTAERELAGATA